jgi:hypothetical protein
LLYADGTHVEINGNQRDLTMESILLLHTVCTSIAEAQCSKSSNADEVMSAYVRLVALITEGAMEEYNYETKNKKTDG